MNVTDRQTTLRKNVQELVDSLAPQERFRPKNKLANREQHLLIIKQSLHNISLYSQTQQ